MIQTFRLIACVLLLSTVSIANAQDDAPKKKRGNAKNRQGGAMLLKKLKAAELTEDQLAKVKELAAKVKTDIKAVREAGLTQELAKQKLEFTDALRKADTKQKEIAAKVLAEFGEEKNELFKKASAINSKFRNAVYALLTDEQVSKLPEETQKQVKMALRKSKGKGNQKGKKKKAATTES